MDRVALVECTSEELGDALTQVHALENAVRSTLVELVQACDQRKCWVEDGCQTLETWLAMCLGIAWRTAAELVRVARGLEDLPAISSVFGSGVLSWDKARALACVATPESDAVWAEEAPTTPVRLLERAARAAKERDEGEAVSAREGQKLVFRDDRDRPVTRIHGVMPKAVAERIRTAVEREADKIPANPETGEFDSYASRRVDALDKICSQSLGADTDADRSTVVLFQSPDGSMRYGDGTGMPPSVADYFSCDCREQHPDGSVSSVISASLRRLVLRRDGGCTFPGCEQRHWLHLHHLVWRSRGGPTEAWNLRARCGFHHRVVHQAGWRETMDPDGTVHIYRPDGTEVGVDPPEPLRPELRHRLEDWLEFRGPHPPDTEWRDTG